MIQRATALLCCIVLGACGTTSVGLKYAPPATVSKAASSAKPVLVGTFTDSRGEPANWLGAIRGGFGNPLKNLESDKPVSEIVGAAFVDALRARGVVVDQGPTTARLTGTIKQLDCNQYARREANAELEVRVVAAGGEVRFTKTYSTTRVDGSLLTLSTGVFASVEDLRVTLEATLREVVDKALDDTELRAALQI
jgi:uncharacterized lipoprotein YajG